MAIDEDLITKNPCRNIELPRHIKEEKRALTEAESQKIKQAEGLDAFHRAYLHLLYGTGMRPAEMFALTWADIDLKNGTVTINKALQFTNSRVASVGLPKTDKSIRTIPLPTFVIGSLAAFKNEHKHFPATTLFAAENGSLRTRSAYRNIFDVCMRKLGLKQIVPYMLRHNFCTQCFFSGMDMKTCQYIMGHASTKMILEVYTHLEQKQNTLKAAVNNLQL